MHSDGRVGFREITLSDDHEIVAIEPHVNTGPVRFHRLDGTPIPPVRRESTRRIPRAHGRRRESHRRPVTRRTTSTVRGGDSGDPDSSEPALGRRHLTRTRSGVRS